MAQTLEAIRSGGGSIRVGTVGTIGSLMTRELESSSNSASPISSRRNPISRSHGNAPLTARTLMNEASTSIKARNPEAIQGTRGQNHHRIPVITATAPKRQKQKMPLEDVNKETGRRNPNFPGKTRNHTRSYHIPMLGSENIHLEKTPIREKPMRKGSNIVDIVDIKCGNPAASLSNRLKKLGFSKLSHSFM